MPGWVDSQNLLVSHREARFYSFLCVEYSGQLFNTADGPHLSYAIWDHTAKWAFDVYFRH